MEELLTKVSTLGITLDSTSATQIAEIWFKAEMIKLASTPIIMLSILIGTGIIASKLMKD